MTFPTRESVTSTDFGSDTTEHLANMPATVNAGDLLLAFACFDSAAAITTPAGWTALGSGSLDHGSIVSGVYAKIADGTEAGGTVDFLTSAAQQGTVQVYRITGWVGRLAALVVSQFSAGGTMLIWGWGYRAQDNLWISAQAKSQAAAFSAVDGNYSDSTTSGQDSAAGGAIASAWRQNAVAMEGPVSAWLNSTTHRFLICVPPVGGAGVPRAQSAIGV